MGTIIMLLFPFNVFASISRGGSTAYLLGSFLGAALMFLLGVLFLKDVWRIGGRLKRPSDVDRQAG